ncbi:MAG: hypothetical protein GF417_02005 [Candidatus Latescibacteria bacterium]|nr:hypothetical protein [bacterium]MBD3423202.1 hypothetical protein [Candidatus Latescibacterota bacterium]
MKREEKAVSFFNRGFNCAQSVVLAHADLLDTCESELSGFAAGFGAGMGMVQSVCGAVSGAVMVIGSLLYREEDRASSKQLVYSRVNRLISRFGEEFRCLECIDLIGIDISTPEGMSRAEEEGVFRDRCEKYVAGACRILDEII